MTVMFMAKVAGVARQDSPIRLYGGERSTSRTVIFSLSAIRLASISPSSVAAIGSTAAPPRGKGLSASPYQVVAVLISMTAALNTPGSARAARAGKPLSRILGSKEWGSGRIGRLQAATAAAMPRAK